MSVPVRESRSRADTEAGLLPTVIRLKVQLTAFVVLTVGVILPYVLLGLVERYPQYFGFLHYLPLHPLADACLIALIVGVTYEWVVRREAERHLHIRLERLLDDQRAAFAMDVSRALVVDQNAIARLSGADVDRLTRDGLRVIAKDSEFADGVYDGVLRALLNYEERWYNYRYRVAVTPIRDTLVAAAIRSRCFQAYIDLSYETVLKRTEFHFICVSSIEEYNEVLRDRRYQERWRMPDVPGLPITSSQAFDVEYMRVGDLKLNVRRDLTADGKRAVVICDHPDLWKLVDKRVTVHYRYEAKLRRLGHLFQVNVVCPTRGVTMEFDFAESDIEYVNTMDLFVTSEQPHIRYIPSRQKPHRIEVETSEWVFPKSGAVFVWWLLPERELAETASTPS